MKPLTVGQLREKMLGLPHDTPVAIVHNNSGEWGSYPESDMARRAAVSVKGALGEVLPCGRKALVIWGRNA